MTRNRLHFAEMMQKIWNGMDSKEAIQILGSPDRVLASPWITTMSFPNNTQEVLCYGVEGNSSFPTLGHLYVNTQGQIHFFEPPPPPSKNLALPESEIRETLRVIDSLPGILGDSFNPSNLIHVANSLIQFRQKQVVELILEYLRLVPVVGKYPPAEGLFMLTRVLFEIPKGLDHIPYPNLGVATPDYPNNRAILPRFPIVLVEDIPFLAVDKYGYFGYRGTVRDEVIELNKRSIIRHKLITPTSNLREAFVLVTRKEIMCELAGLPPSRDNEAVLRGRFANQLLRMAPKIDAFTKLLDKGGVPYDPLSDHIQRMIEFENAIAKAVRWNEASNSYATS